MKDNMELIKQIGEVRSGIKKRETEKTRAENLYKQKCTKLGIKPISSNGEDQEDDVFNEKESKTMRDLKNPARTQDDETLFGLRKEIDARRSHLDVLKSSIEEAR